MDPRVDSLSFAVFRSSRSDFYTYRFFPGNTIKEVGPPPGRGTPANDQGLPAACPGHARYGEKYPRATQKEAYSVHPLGVRAMGEKPATGKTSWPHPEGPPSRPAASLSEHLPRAAAGKRKPGGGQAVRLALRRFRMDSYLRASVGHTFRQRPQLKQSAGSVLPSTSPFAASRGHALMQAPH